MNLSQRYHGSKGFQESRQEEPPLEQSDVPCESGGQCFALHGAFHLAEGGGGAKPSPPGNV